MTSVPSHLPRLSGSKWITWSIACLLLASVTSCNLFKPVVNDDQADIIKDDNLDPVTGKTKKDPKKDNTDIVVVPKPNAPDTVSWVAEDNATDVVTVDDNVADTTQVQVIDPDVDGDLTQLDIPRGTQKSAYRMSVMLPLYTDDFLQSNAVSSRAIRSLNFYQGIMMGVEQLNMEGLNMTVHIYDTRVNPVGALTTDPDVQQSDFIIGPVVSDEVAQMAQVAKSQQKLILSLNSKEGLTQHNPYYLQSSPSFKTHCQSMVAYIQRQYPDSDVKLLGRDDEAANFSAIQSAWAQVTDAEAPLSAYRVDGSKVNYDIRDFTQQLSKTDTTVIIIPSSKESFVRYMLRELSLLRRTYPIVVFGMPRWMAFDDIEPDYFEKTNVHISSSEFIDNTDPMVQSFKTNFFQKYGMPPLPEAYKGYDFMCYFGRLLKEHGTDLLYYLNTSELPHPLLHSKVNFKPVISFDDRLPGKVRIDHFENQHVNILRFQGYQFNNMSH